MVWGCGHCGISAGNEYLMRGYEYIIKVFIVFQDDLCKIANGQDLYVMLPGIVYCGGDQVCADPFAFMFIDFGMIDDHFMSACHPVR